MAADEPLTFVAPKRAQINPDELTIVQATQVYIFKYRFIALVSGQ